MSNSVDTLTHVVRDHRWYHQGFDATPLLLSYIGEGEVAVEPRKPAGMEGTLAICFFSAGHADWYFDQRDLERGTDVMIALAKQNPHIGADIRAHWKNDEITFEKLFADFDPHVLASLSDDALIQLYTQYYRATVARYTSTSVIDHFALGSDQLIADMVRKECGPFASATAFNQLFSALTAPVFRSFMHDAELALIAVAQNETPEAIEQYRKQFFWKKNNYIASHELSQAEVQDELHHLRETTPDLVAAQTQLLEAPARAAAHKADLFKQCAVSDVLRSLIALSDEWSQWQDERKRSTFIATYIFDSFLQEFGRRVQLDHELLKYVLPSEMHALLADHSLTTQQLEERMHLCAVVYSADGLVVYVGDDAVRLQNAMHDSQRLHARTAIRGLVAHTGVATGRVRVMTSATEVGTMQQGEVLVATMTRPDYISAMKKASAIVTDEGGITCHAAIVSRELKIPCIIGTQNATTQLHTGDMVRVDANINSVTIL